MARNVKRWNDLRDWAATNAAALRLCLRMTVAGLLAYVLAASLALPQGYWAVFSAIIIASQRRRLHQSHHGPIDWDNRRCGLGRGRGVFIAPHKRVVSWRCTRHCPRAADIGGSVVAQLPDRTADGRNRTLDTGRATTRAP
jgi:hypothetical protein